MGRALAALVCILSVVVGCTAASSTAPPTGDPAPSTLASPTTAPSALPTGAPSPSDLSPTPTAPPTPASSTAGSSAAPALPVRGDAGDTGRPILMAPTADGSLYVAIPHPAWAVLALLDPAGRPAPGWPVKVPNATRCFFVGVAEDGSARAVCDATDLRQPDLCCDTVRAFAFDRDGRPLPGWPVEIDTIAAARVVGDDLVVVSDLQTTDIVEFGSEISQARLSRISTDGNVHRSPAVPIVFRGGGEGWAIGPDAVAYGTSYIAASEEASDPPWVRSEILAVGLGGLVDGWPVAIEGIASTPGFDTDGRILVNVGTWDEPPTRVLAIDPAGKGTAVSSDALPLTGAASGLSCAGGLPVPPLAAEGLIVTSDAGVSGQPTFYALDATLETVPGWPYRPPRGLQETGYPEPGDVDCAGGPPVEPALARDGTLYLSLLPVSDPAGGSLTAVGRASAVVDGWPVDIGRPAAAFWLVVVGPDGTVFALAVERETHGASATILAIQPDSTVRWRTTVLEP